MLIFIKIKIVAGLLKKKNFEERIQKILENIAYKKSDYLSKKENLKKLNYQNTWNNVNQKILGSINEN